jgi:alkylated DNA nucleotide flippase Atl1
VRKLLAVCILIGTYFGANAQQGGPSQDRQVRFVLVRLKDSMPLANQRLVVFMGATVKEARRHSIRVDLKTDSSGVTTLSIGPHISWFQVWHEEGKLCPGGIPSRDVFHSSVLFDEGALVSDTCGRGLERLQPYFLQVIPPVYAPLNP